MFAIIETGGKQYKVKPGSVIKTELLSGKNGKEVVFDKVLLKLDENGISLGSPYIEGIAVNGEVVSEGRAKKKIVFRYHSKTRYRKKKGHRQPFSEVKITAI